MIDGFEARLVNLLADRLAGTTDVVSIDRMRDGLTQPTAAGPRATVAVLSANPDSELGDDRQERLGAKGSYAERPVLRLAGEAVVRVQVREASNVNQRLAILRALDRLLLVLQAQDVRDGSGFQTGADLGFALDGGFRVTRVAGVPTGTDLSEHRRFDILCAFSGRFWPVIAATTGPAIRTIPVRTVVLPMTLPDRISTRAGVPLDVVIPVDLRATAGAPLALAARLQGASPQGSLTGVTTGLPPGFVAVPVANGALTVRYRPPATVTEAFEEGVELRYAWIGSSFPILETFSILVTP
ncbi:MAG TPA: hypothetical protein PKA64_11045 [Myxococcota bacterium]|nr:hypothetical protein [Myxococcota bacterium]